MNQALSPTHISPQLEQFLAAPVGVHVHKSAFSSHGLWTPGVRLMRNCQFVVKAALICLMFLIPMCYVTTQFYISKKSSIDFSTKERLGIEYTREIFPVLDLAHQYRRDAAATASGKRPATFDEVKSKIKAAQARLANVELHAGAALGTAKAYAAVQSAFAKAEGASPSELFKAHEAHFATLLALLTVATDNSNLSLDPDLDSYYVMDAALFRAPDIIESTGKLRGTGMAVMRAGAASPAQQQDLSEAITIAEFQFRNMRDGLSKAFANTPALSAKVNANQTLDDTAAIFELARKSVINAQDYSPENQARYLAAANKASEAQNALVSRLLVELDALIAKRVADMTFDLYQVAAVMLIGVLLAGYFFYTFFLVTRGGLQLIRQHLIEMAEGDLRRPPNLPWGKDEPALVIVDLRKAYSSLHMLIRKVRHSARALHAASGEISSASTDLSARTEAAAASLEEQAAAMEEISATVGMTAERAQQASSFAIENAQVAEKSGQVFTAVERTMQDIQSSSSKIHDIISVIDGIAFQTNILALNAAVEAARAGESGRGFAVVASEVRSLAGRSAAAAREIKGLIVSSVEQVKGGTTVVKEAGQTLQTVVLNAKQITTFLADISSACREEASGVEQAGQAIQELDKSTQQNSALVEETMAASAALTDQANILQSEIANFRVA